MVESKIEETSNYKSASPGIHKQNKSDTILSQNVSGSEGPNPKKAIDMRRGIKKGSLVVLGGCWNRW